MTEQTPAPVKRGFGYAALIGVALLGLYFMRTERNAAPATVRLVPAW